MMIASSLTRAGIEVPNRTKAPTRWTRSHRSGLRRSALNGPRSPAPRGPDWMASATRFCSGVMVSAVSVVNRPSLIVLDHPFLLQGGDVVLGESEHLAVDVGVVGAEDRRGRDLDVALRHLHRPAGDDDLAADRMVDLGEDLALAHRRIFGELHGVEHGAARHPGAAELLHRLVLGVLLGPRLDVAVDLVVVVAAERRGREALVGLEVLAPDHLAEPLPVRVGGAARVDVDVVVLSARLALEDVAGSVAEHDPVALPLAGLIGEELRRIGDAAVVHHGVLHGDLDLLAATGDGALEERGEHADRGMQARAGVAEGD